MGIGVQEVATRVTPARRRDASRRRGRLIYARSMPMYMDVHPGLGEATADDVAEAHRRDLETQDRYGVRFLSYWFSDPSGKAFCLAEAPDQESLRACHKAAHGLMPHEVIEVDAPTLGRWMGNTDTDAHDRRMVEGAADSALRAIMFTDIEGSTDVSTRHGDQAAMSLVRHHDTIVREALERHSGREVKHTGDGVLASFVSVSKAVGASIEIQQASRIHQGDGPRLAIKIGISAGEPVQESADLYGAAVNLAARICAQALGGQTLVSGTVRDLTIGKSHRFVGRGAIGLKGFPDPVPLFEVDWHDDRS